MQIRLKGEISLELENGFTISYRMMELLMVIEKTGSLNQAAKDLGVSYSHSWNILNRLNCQLQQPIVITQRGGKGGGIAQLTTAGKSLLQKYLTVRSTFFEILEGYCISIDDIAVADDSPKPDVSKKKV
ncbi:MAG: LysR family transcriptional regulator [Deltaproteobacteria bacterium]|nr:LysR family transcriptional regulator [Deltaproteobacteria bacterium]